MMEENEGVNGMNGGGMRGGNKYWPQYPIKVITTNNFNITLVGENSSGNTHIRILQLYKTSENKSKKIVHIQYSEW